MVSKHGHEKEGAVQQCSLICLNRILRTLKGLQGKLFNVGLSGDIVRDSIVIGMLRLELDDTDKLADIRAGDRWTGGTYLLQLIHKPSRIFQTFFVRVVKPLGQYLVHNPIVTCQNQSTSVSSRVSFVCTYHPRTPLTYTNMISPV